MWFGDMNGWVFAGGFFMMLLWIALLVLVVWGIVKLVQREDSSSSARGKSNALDIARERYARGEITKAEFEQLKKDL